MNKHNNEYEFGECEITRIDAEMAKDLGLTEGDVLLHRPSDGAVFLHCRKDDQIFRLAEEFNETGEFSELVWKAIATRKDIPA